MSWERSFSGVAMRSLIDRKVARDGRAFADDRIDANLASVQLDKGAHQRQAEAGAATPRAVRMRLEPVEHLVLDVGRNARTGIGHGEDDTVLAPTRAQADSGVLRRKSDGVRQEIIQNLHPAALGADEASDIGIAVALELDAVGREPVLDAFGGGLDGLADLDRGPIERHRNGWRGG